MNFLSLLGGGFTKTVSDLVDNLHTSEEEKLEAKLEMLKLNSEHQYRMEKIQADLLLQVGLAKGQLEINKEEAKSGMYLYCRLETRLFRSFSSMEVSIMF